MRPPMPEESQHPLFFDWVEEPNYKVRALWRAAAPPGRQSLAAWPDVPRFLVS